MSSPIIAALRSLRQLPESLLHTAQELAHRASIYGVVRVSYSYLGQKCHCSRRTAIRHIKVLKALGIIRYKPIWIAGNFCEVNTYTFTISWRTEVAQKGGSDTMTSQAPTADEREKNLSLTEEIRRCEKALRFCTEGSDAYQTTLEKLGRLRQLQEDAHARLE